MPLAGIQFSPAIPDAAIETTCAATGEPTGELRLYVIEAPVSSALMDRTVDQIARLPQRKAARGLLTPDVPGYYTVEVRDITLSQQLPKFAGEVVAQNSDDDDSLWDEGRLYATYDRVRTQAGRYFWYTRNGHGRGFWEDDEWENTERLMEVAQQYNEVYLYVGDDGMDVGIGLLVAVGIVLE